MKTFTTLVIIATLLAILLTTTYVTASQDPFDSLADALAEALTMKRRRGGKRGGRKGRFNRQPQVLPAVPVLEQPVAQEQPPVAQEEPQEQADSSAVSCTQRYPLFKQCGQAWSSQLIRTDTICKSGCLMTSMCMALNGRGKTSMNPGQFTTYLKSNGGFSGNLFVWGSVAKFGLTYDGKIKGASSIAQKLCAGNIVILNVRYGGHWVLATGYDQAAGLFTVNDPGYSKSTYLASEVTQAAIYH